MTDCAAAAIATTVKRPALIQATQRRLTVPIGQTTLYCDSQDCSHVSYSSQYVSLCIHQI
jgi:hypothetical protein